MKRSSLRQTPDHQASHRDVDHGLAALWQGFVILQDLVIVCSPLLVAGMVDAFRFQIKHARWDAVVLWSGSSLRYGQGVIVLEWYEPIPAECVKALQRDAEAIDYFFYDVPYDMLVGPLVQLRS